MFVCGVALCDHVILWRWGVMCVSSLGWGVSGWEAEQCSHVKPQRQEATACWCGTCAANEPQMRYSS